jgi:hypothetical protein
MDNILKKSHKPSFSGNSTAVPKAIFFAAFDTVFLPGTHLKIKVPKLLLKCSV